MDLSAKTIRDLLAELEWFSTLGPKRIGALAARAETLVFEPGETVFEEGDEGDRCYVIHTGQVKAVRSLADGRRVALAQIGAGGVFGELAMFGRKRRSTTIQAVEPTVASAWRARTCSRRFAATPNPPSASPRCSRTASRPPTSA